MPDHKQHEFTLEAAGGKEKVLAIPGAKSVTGSEEWRTEVSTLAESVQTMIDKLSKAKGRAWDLEVLDERSKVWKYTSPALLIGGIRGRRNRVEDHSSGDDDESDSPGPGHGKRKRENSSNKGKRKSRGKSHPCQKDIMYTADRVVEKVTCRNKSTGKSAAVFPASLSLSDINKCYQYFRGNFKSTEAKALGVKDFKRILRRGCYNLTNAEIGGKKEDREYDVEQATDGKKIKVEKMPAPTEHDSDDSQSPRKVPPEFLPDPTPEPGVEAAPAPVAVVAAAVPPSEYEVQVVEQRQKVNEELQRRLQNMRDLGVPVDLLGGKGGTASKIPSPKAVQSAPDPPEKSAARAKAKAKPTAAEPDPAAAKAKSTAAKAISTAAKAKSTAPDANAFPEPPKRRYLAEDLSQYSRFFSSSEMKSTADKLVKEKSTEKTLVSSGDLVGRVCQEAFGTGTNKRWYLGLVLGYIISDEEAEGKVYLIIFQDADSGRYMEGAVRLMCMEPRLPRKATPKDLSEPDDIVHVDAPVYN
ncbi:hypothetical protein CYMTET_52145 [Cymbomonas tetramitiformis]|uniref:Uncharacterized protein n=1 Tax=Cymbomonas tetramitiformis TaxID=36881 RepID=A0AAE0ET16_9CHLO|nr:hypothetical protein CYMTET_52145 [Cymbomonas tetramitiformis]